MTLEAFPDIELLLKALLEEWYEDDVELGTVTPADLDTRLAAGKKFIQVELVTGNDDVVTDYSIVSLGVFAADRQAGYDLAEDMRARLLSGPHRVGTAVIDKVKTEVKPFGAPWDNPSVHRRLATYRLSARR